MVDKRYMRLALKLALKGEGRVEPNPMVGAVIVRNNKIIGQGYHQYFGGPHAEINAINSVHTDGRRWRPERVKNLLKGATLYLTLEPCSHFGKTPPCAEAIVSSGIKRVVIASRDPNPLVRGRGVRLLKQHGINVIEAVLAKEARAINKPFFWRHKGAMALRRQKHNKKGLPYVVAKWSMSKDGKLVTRPGQGRWITTKYSRDYAKEIRGQCQGVMVGIGTVLADNPILLPQINTDKHRKKPIRIVLDSNARLPLNSNLIRTIDKGDVYLMVSSSAPQKKVRLLEKKGVRVFRVPGRKRKLDFMAVLRTLAKNGVNKLMIEGGAEVLASAFHYKVVDEVYCFIAPKVIGGNNTLSAKRFFKNAEAVQHCIPIKDIKSDILIHVYTGS